MSDPVYDKPNGAESVRSFFKRLDKLELGQKPGAATLSGDFFRAVRDLLADFDSLAADMERVQLVPDAEHAYQQGLMARAEAAEAERDALKAQPVSARVDCEGGVNPCGACARCVDEACEGEMARAAERDEALARVVVLREAIETHRDCSFECPRCGESTPCLDDDVCLVLADPDKAAAERDERLREAMRSELQAEVLQLDDDERRELDALIAGEARAKALKDAAEAIHNAAVQHGPYNHGEIYEDVVRALAADKPKGTAGPCKTCGGTGRFRHPSDCIGCGGRDVLTCFACNGEGRR